MPCEINYEAEGLYVRLSDIVRAEDIVGLVDAMHSPNAQAFKYRLTDCQLVTDFHLSDVQIAHILSIDYLLSLDHPTMRRALVANDPILIGKIERLAERFHACSDYKLFETVQGARDWLAKEIFPV